MQSPHFFEFTFDAVKVSQIALLTVCVCVLLLLKKNLAKNRYGFLFVMLLAIAILNSYVLKFTSLSIPNVLILFVLLAGPTLLFHIKEYQMVGSASKKNYLKHIYFGVGVSILYLFHISKQLDFFLAIIAIAHFGYYLVLSVNALSSKRIVTANHSKINIDLLKKRWSRDFYLLIAIFFVYVTAIIESFFVEIKMQYRFTFIVMLLSSITLLFWLLILRFKSMYQFYEKSINAKKNKYKNSILSKAESEKISLQLKGIMNEQKLYLDSEISLKTIADELKIHPKVLSQAINENLGGNFFEYINSLRIEEAKKMLTNPFYKEYKIYEIMYEVGFNSRSSFNTSFKKNTGMTAREFRDNRLPS